LSTKTDSTNYKTFIPSGQTDDTNEDACEAIGCFAKFTDIIALKVAEKKTISVKLCKECVKKFD